MFLRNILYMPTFKYNVLTNRIPSSIACKMNDMSSLVYLTRPAGITRKGLNTKNNLGYCRVYSIVPECKALYLGLHRC